jgi:DNA-binding transcriptional ArsR family regulator
MLKGSDILVLAKLISGTEISVRPLADALDLPRSNVARSLDRLRAAGLVVGDGIDGSRALEFLRHAVKYIVPAGAGDKQARGLATGSYAPPFDAEFVGGTTPFVWSQARGPDRGFPIEPLAENVAELARMDTSLRSVLAAIDALRVEGAREREAASKYLANALAQVGAFG